MAAIAMTDMVPFDADLDFDTFFRQHHAPLVRTLTAVCGSREEAADAVQDAFVKAHARWDSVSRMDEPAAWVRRVAINKVRDVYRREEVGRRVRLKLVRDDRPVPPPEPPSGLAQAMASLPKQQRVAMALFYVHELSVAEVAAAMELSAGAVKFHLHEGRKRLRPLLGGDDG